MQPKIRLIPLGGIGNVTKNMYLYEFENQILIVDCGIGFPDATMLGVDLLIPDVSYLEEKKANIIGMLLSHGHDDHIGGLPYILPQINTGFPILGSPLTIGFAKNRIKEFAIDANFQIVPETTFQLGRFTIDSVKMTHSVPDARHFAITTPAGTVYHGTDFKFDLNPVDGVLPDFQKIAKIGSSGVIALLSDALNSEVQSFSESESSLRVMFEREFRGIAGKCIITVMSSNIHRIQQAVNVASSYGRQIAFLGRSIEQNVQTAQSLGLLKLPKGIVHKREINNLPPQKLCVIIAGAQGQEGSSLTRAAEGEHNFISINPEDKVIFASEAIPGNEYNVYATIDSLSRTGADVTYSDLDDSVHVSGHSSAIEQKLLIAILKPQRLIPIGGTFHHMIEYRRLARSMGYKDKNIHLLENGQVMAINAQSAGIDETLDLKNVMVDGLGIGDVGHIVLRDRQRMADEGIVVIIVPVEAQTGQVRGEIEIISRGFVYVKENQEIMADIKEAAIKGLKGHQGTVTNWQSIRLKIEQAVENLVFKVTNRRPLILSVVIEV